MSLISDELGQASTKKKEFLGIMEKLIPWSQWVGIVQPHYYKGERGNKPYDLELMLRIYVLQHLYNLADDAARNEIIDSRAFSQFCGVDSSNQVPDGDTIGRFRHILEQNQLGEAFFTNVVESLQKCNLMLKKGTIVDSTLIAAPSSTKNKEKQRDPEAHSVKKGNQWYFGYKEHIGVDADSGLVHTVETTAANVHDSNMVVELLQGTEEDVYGDSGYLGAEKKDDAILVNNEGHPIRYQINKRPSQLKKASGEKFELLKAIEHAKSSVRSKVNMCFAHCFPPLTSPRSAVIFVEKAAAACAAPALKYFCSILRPNLAFTQNLGLTPKTAGSSTLDADLGVRVSFAASKCLAIFTE